MKSPKNGSEFKSLVYITQYVSFFFAVCFSIYLGNEGWLDGWFLPTFFLHIALVGSCGKLTGDLKLFRSPQGKERDAFRLRVSIYCAFLNRFFIYFPAVSFLWCLLLAVQYILISNTILPVHLFLQGFYNLHNL